LKTDYFLGRSARNTKASRARVQVLFVPLYFLKYIHALRASKATVKIHKDESLIPVFFAISTILSESCVAARDSKATKNCYSRHSLAQLAFLPRSFVPRAL